MASGADVVPRDIQAHHAAADRRPEGNVDLIFEVGAGLGAFFGLGCTVAAAEDRSEDVAETAAAAPAAGSAAPGCAVHQIGKIEAAKIERNTLAAILRRARKSSGSSRSAARAGIRLRGCGIDVVGVEPDLIVDLALFGIAEDVVGFGEGLELLLRRLVPRIYVGMVLARQLAERLADVVRRSALLYAENFVVVLLRGSCHCAQFWDRLTADPSLIQNLPSLFIFYDDF